MMDDYADLSFRLISPHPRCYTDLRPKEKHLPTTPTITGSSINPKSVCHFVLFFSPVLALCINLLTLLRWVGYGVIYLPASRQPSPGQKRVASMAGEGGERGEGAVENVSWEGQTHFPQIGFDVAFNGMSCRVPVVIDLTYVQT